MRAVSIISVTSRSDQAVDDAIRMDFPDPFPPARAQKTVTVPRDVTHPDETAAGQNDFGEFGATLVVGGEVALLVEALAGDGCGEEEVLLCNGICD